MSTIKVIKVTFGLAVGLINSIGSYGQGIRGRLISYLSSLKTRFSKYMPRSFSTILYFHRQFFYFE